LALSVPATAGVPAYMENGCTDPVDIKAKATASAYGTRLFVSCFDSDTLVPIEYNSGMGSNTVDTFSPNLLTVADVVSTDAFPNANSTTGTYVNACSQGGSTCPNQLTLMPNPALHFVTGGIAPASSPVALAKATNSANYDQYVVVAGGVIGGVFGGTPARFTDVDHVFISFGSPCSGLSFNSSTGEISGRSLGTSGQSCGGTTGFIIRVTDATGQFVERAFRIPIQ